MNLNHPSIEDFKELIRNTDDSVNRMLVVNHNGVVEIICPDEMLPSEVDSKYKFYYEIWLQGNDYSGPNAAEDIEYIEQYYNSLIDNWKKGTRSSII